jgi:AbrB family looped-hinge helix DNA binding protein
MFISNAKLTSKGQITLPAAIRKHLGAARGDTVVFELIDGRMVIRKGKSVEGYFSTLPPLKRDFKRELDGVIAAEIKGRSK